MNIISFILSIFAVIVFAGAFQGHKYGSLGAGLALLTVAWMVQLIRLTSTIIKVG